MKNLHVFIAGIIGLFLLTGCAGTNLSQHVNNDVTQTSVVLSQNNYRIVGETSGTSTSTYILGIGGLSKIDKGSIYVDEEKITKVSVNKIDKIRSLKIGYIFQNFNLLKYNYSLC